MVLVVGEFFVAAVAVATVVYCGARILFWMLKDKYQLGEWGGK